MDKIIIILDDEPLTEKGFRSTVENLEEYYNDEVSVKIFQEILDCWKFIKENHEQVIMIFCDLLMPEADGITFLHQVSATYPDIRLILMSGGEIDTNVLNENKFLSDYVSKDKLHLKIPDIVKDVLK